ncbi:MAG: DUF1501 domain-containing protein [Microlunatus sp.]|nr:DUF1501 domain-containing protein [Microlunatus sp.]
MVTLYGGNDGLNTVVPAGNPAYARARAELAYRPDDVLDLGDGLGLNPGLTGLHRLWADHELAVVRGVGYPKPDRSHFRSMAIWQTASPATAASTGWLGRWLDTTTTDPLLAVSLDTLIPPMLAGATAAGASLPVRGLRVPKTALGRSLALLGRPDQADGIWQARAATSIADLGRVQKTLEPAAAKNPDEDSAGSDENAQGASAGGQSELGRQLDLVATLVEMGVPTRVYAVSLGGFDTHAGERGTQQRLLTELDRALTTFQTRLAGTDRGRQVVTAVYSEFGRRVTANASDGTDHGTAGPVFVLGRGVTGGFYGAEPSLTDLDSGDLKAGMDFRSVYASLLDSVLGTDPGAVLNGWEKRVEGLFT